MNKSKFRRGMNVIVECRCCLKKTHSSIDGYVDIRLCRICLDSSGQENAHSDGAHDGMTVELHRAQGCPDAFRVSCMHELREVTA